MREVISYDKNFLKEEVKTSTKLKPAFGTRGKVSLSLYDTDGNKERELITENIITDILSENAYHDYVIGLTKGLFSQTYISSPFNALILSDSDIEESAKIKKVLGKMIGFTNRTETYSGNSEVKGGYNSKESNTYLDEDGNLIIHLVYDYPTHAANGIIKSMFWSSRAPIDNITHLSLGDPRAMSYMHEDISNNASFSYADKEWKEILPFRYESSYRKLQPSKLTYYNGVNNVPSAYAVHSINSNGIHTHYIYDVELFTGKCNFKKTLKNDDGTNFKTDLSMVKVVGNEIIGCYNRDIYIFDKETCSLKSTNIIHKKNIGDWAWNFDKVILLNDGKILTYTAYYNSNSSDKKYINKIELRDKYTGEIITSYDFEKNDGNYMSSSSMYFSIRGAYIHISIVNDNNTSIDKMDVYEIKSGEYVRTDNTNGITSMYNSESSGFLCIDESNLVITYSKVYNQGTRWGIGTIDLPVSSYVKLPNEVVKTNTNTMKVQYDFVIPKFTPGGYIFE